MEEKKIRKISKETFSQKYSKLRKKHLEVLNTLKIAFKKDFKNAKLPQEKRIIKKRHRKQRLIQENKFALHYNALKNQELYRKGAKESQINKAKSDFHKRRNEISTFNFDEEKKQLKDKIKKIEKKYSMPVSMSLRKSRINKTDEPLGFIRVPLTTPFKKNIKSILLILLAAAISTLSLDVFIKPFGIYNAGLRGITQSIYYAIQHYHRGVNTWVSYLLFIAFNIPLAIFGYKKVGKKFTIFTIIYLIFQYLISLLIDSTDIQDKIKPFGDTASQISSSVLDGNYQKDHPALFLLSAPIGGILYGISIGLVYKSGASGGGSKFIVTYFSMTKNKSVGQLAMLFSIFVVTFGVILNHIILKNTNVLSAFTSITIFSTIFFVFISNTVIDIIFSKSRKETISVITNKKDSLLRFFDVKLMYNRTFTVASVNTSFDKNPKHKIDFVVSASESKMLTKIITQIDPNAYINIIQTRKVYGKFYSRWFE